MTDSSSSNATTTATTTPVDTRAASTVAADLMRDTAITARIKGQFMSKDRFDNTDIKVNTDQGVVSLQGQVATTSQREWAESTCLGVEGVVSVHNALNVVPASGSFHADQVRSTKAERVAADTWLTTKIKAELLGDSVTKSFQVHVKTYHGVVSLQGELANAQAVAHVTDLVAHIDKVKRVDASGLTVKHIPLSH